MVVEILIICVTVLILFGPYMAEKTRALAIENEESD